MDAIHKLVFVCLVDVFCSLATTCSVKITKPTRTIGNCLSWNVVCLNVILLGKLLLELNSPMGDMASVRTCNKWIPGVGASVLFELVY